MEVTQKDLSDPTVLHEQLEQYYERVEGRKEYDADHPIAGWYECQREDCNFEFRYNPTVGELLAELRGHEEEHATE